MPGRVLIVEDEMLVSMLLEDMLEELGYQPVGPAARLDRALEKASDAAIEAAILDVNLNGQTSFSVANVLRRRGIPFIFVTGYDASVSSEHFQNTPVLQKPFQRHELARALDAIMRPQHAG